MGILDSDDDKADAVTIRALFRIFPKAAGDEAMRSLTPGQARDVREALSADSAELRQGSRHCTPCRSRRHASCKGQGCTCG